jgi:hypothetical protein
MGLVLRIIGGLWILLSARLIVGLLQRLLASGVYVHVGLMDLLNLLMLAGGIGLLLLREWGRWLILIGCIVLLFLKAGGPLLQLKFPPWVLKSLIFYGIFIVILCLPQARSVTRK